MNVYDLNFARYCWRGNEDTAPESSGVYCAYSCVKQEGQLFVDELLYVGQTGNLRNRLKEHTSSGKFKPELDAGKVVFYAWAVLDGRSLTACEAAMISHYRPRYNEQLKDGFRGHDVTRVSCSGEWAFRVKGEFTEEPTV